MEKKLEDCIITLIEDDIVIYKVISELSRLGIESNCFYSNSTYVVKYLLGYEKIEEDVWLNKYFDLIKEGLKIDINESRTEIKELSLKIFDSLKFYK